MARITQYRTDMDLCEILVTQSKETVLWMRDHGVRFMPNFGRQAFRVNGRFKFWGGATIAVSSGGPGLVDSLYRAAEAQQVEIIFEAWVRDLLRDDGGIRGVIARIGGETVADRMQRPSCSPACGRFEANAEWRARYLGPGWDFAKVRGAPASIAATASPWRWRTAHNRTVTGPAATPRRGSVTPARSGISR